MITMGRMALLALLALAVVGCSPGVQADTAQSKEPRVTSDAQPSEVDTLVQGNRALAIDLYHLLKDEVDGNLFYSPYSISVALAMTYAGARGETEAQMAEALHFTLDQERLHAAFNALDASLTGTEQEGFELRIANALWGQKGFGFRQPFLDLLARNYGAGMRLVDFAQETEKARKIINDWVSQQTNGKITDLIPPGVLNPLTRLVLTNAIYFNAKWEHPFDKANTHDDAFHRLDGDTVTVPMMSQSLTVPYAKGDGYQALVLPYKGGRMAFMAILPDEGRFSEVEGRLSPEFLDQIQGSLAPQRIRLTLPRFKYECALDLVEPLRSLGMVDAFDIDKADFSGMTGHKELYVTDVLHKAWVAVDEEGTEAAAATAVVIGLKAIAPPELQVRLDRPFIFAITDTQTGTTLFLGRVLDPS